MPAPASIIPGFYYLEFDQTSSTILPPPKPRHLTSNGEGKQLTLEHPTGDTSQEWYIQPPLGENGDSEYRIIIPWQYKDFKASAVSQDVVQHPDEVSLIKNLQVWSFTPLSESESDDLYLIRSNLYAGLIGSDPLLGADKESKKAIIEHIPVIANNVTPKPVWRLIGPLLKK